MSETATLSPTLVNEARFQFQLASPITQFTPANPSPQFVCPPGISTEGESRAAVLLNHQYEIADTLSLTRGRQYLKFGGGAIFSSSGGNGQEFGSGFTQGQFTFASGAGCPQIGACVPTSQLTLAQVASFTQSFGNANYNVREWLYNVFAQDNVRVRRDLTLNLGLRYERQTFTDDKNNFAPRIGFAYNLLGDNRTVLRGSYGIYYSELRANLAAQYADRIVMLKDGRIVAAGTPTDVLTQGAILETFAIPVLVTRHPALDCPLVVPTPAA